MKHNANLISAGAGDMSHECSIPGHNKPTSLPVRDSNHAQEDQVFGEGPVQEAQHYADETTQTHSSHVEDAEIWSLELNEVSWADQQPECRANAMRFVPEDGFDDDGYRPGWLDEVD